MNRNKLSFVIAIVAAVVVLAGGFFLGVQPQLASASANDTQRATIESTNATNRTELKRLEKQFTKLGGMRSELATLTASIPAKPNTPSFVKSVGDAADGAGVTVTAVTFSDAAAYTAPGQAAAGTDTTPTASASPSASASATATPSPSATPTGPATVTNEAITSSNFTVIPVSISVEGSYLNALAFTKAVQTGKRLFLVNSIVSAPKSTADDSGSSASTAEDAVWTLAGYVFVLDTTAAAAPATTAATTANG
jgi:Tfp pilus assembly protein PilO